jgi:Xaa-Pro aminopeptidase
MNTGLYPRFSAAEFARRHDAARKLMDAQEIDALVVYCSSGVNRHDHADIHYLSGFLGNRNNYAVLTRAREPQLFVQSFNHVPNAREASAIPTEWGGPSSAASVAKHLLDAGLDKATLGYVGDVPVQSYLAWQQQLAGWRFKDVTRAYRRLRLVKSAEEIEWLTRGAALTDAALERLIEGVEPGMREYELGAIIEHEALHSGGLPHLYYISSAPQESEGACVPRQNLSGRVIERGDGGRSHRRARIHDQRRFSARFRHRASSTFDRHARIGRAPRAARPDVQVRGEHVRRRSAQRRHARRARGAAARQCLSHHS